jgi:hypothetical protein
VPCYLSGAVAVAVMQGDAHGDILSSRLLEECTI